jgi:hypothetical protein
MSTDEVNAFLNGIIVMGHGGAGLFFLRFWRKTMDRLFLMFAVSFWLLGIIRVVMAILGQSGEDSHYLYWFRFVAYLVILIAIVDKNLSWRKKRTGGGVGS